MRVSLSITTLDAKLARVMEPRTSSPEARLRAIRELTQAGIRTSVMTAPIIPGLNDSEIPAILTAAREAGAESAGYVMLKLSSTVRPVFLDWLERSYPDKSARVQSLIRSVRGGKLNDANFGSRQVGTGNLAELIADTFRLWCTKLGYADDHPPLNAEAFQPPLTDKGPAAAVLKRPLDDNRGDKKRCAARGTGQVIIRDVGDDRHQTGSRILMLNRKTNLADRLIDRDDRKNGAIGGGAKRVAHVERTRTSPVLDGWNCERRVGPLESPQVMASDWASSRPSE